MANQPLAFGALIGGGLLITSALTGRSIGQVIRGQAGHLSNRDGSARIDSNLANLINSSGKVSEVHGLVNPFYAANARTLHPGRVDMGQDFTLSPGDPIAALGDSRVAGVIHDWYSGQPFYWFQLLNEHGQPAPTPARPYAGKYWYLAEQITPLVQPGQLVKAGQPVAVYAQHGTGIEIGEAVGSGQTAAQAAGDVTPGSHYSSEGQAFALLLQRLGVPA